MTYYACARNDKGQLEQLLVTVNNGTFTQKWTGKIYKSEKDARDDLIYLNT